MIGATRASEGESMKWANDVLRSAPRAAFVLLVGSTRALRSVGTRALISGL
jgi:hypothetical protein